MADFKDVSIGDMLRKTYQLLKPESSFYAISIVYGVGASILALAVPISVQSLVNTVTFGVLTQPLIILSALLLILLIFSGTLDALQVYVIELFQRKFYARTSVDIAVKVINAETQQFQSHNGMELVNRYFDIMTVQKSMASLLTTGISIIIQTIVGFILLAFYHPYFLAFDFFLIFMIWIVWSLFGKRAMQTAVVESKAKYSTAEWLEELARINMLFKSDKNKALAIADSDRRISKYIKTRAEHFKYVFWQTIMLLAIYAVMSAMILGLGGYLVVIGQLSLGQLVAAELVVTVMLANFAKSGKYLESFYDLYAAIDKISYFYDLKTESKRLRSSPSPVDGSLVFEKVRSRSKSHDYIIDFQFKENSSYLIRCEHYSSKVVFFQLLQRTLEPDQGIVYFGGVEIHEFFRPQLRDLIYVIDRPLFFQGTIRDNLLMGNENITQARLNQVLEVVNLHEVYNMFPNGLEEIIYPSGEPFWSSQLIRLVVARAILAEPSVIVISEVFDQIEKECRKKILDFLIAESMTLILFSNKQYKGYNFNDYLYMRREAIEVLSDEGQFAE